MIIFDLDGTLADIAHRRPLVDKQRRGGPQWEEFFMACVRDAPIGPTVRLFRALHDAGKQLQIWSGRSDAVRAQTDAWLERWVYAGRAPVPLRMRPAGDTTPDVELKEGWLHAALAEGDFIDLVIDDRQRVVDMWRRRGIVCLQCAPGNY